jgi:hypothetical protein
MKHHQSERGTTFTSVRHRPGVPPVSAESKTPERAVEGSQRGATGGGALPEQFYRGDFKPSPQHEAEGRIGANSHDTAKR